MDGRVRALYKRLLHLVRSLPESTLKGGVPEARRKLRASFRESGEPLEKALDKGGLRASRLENLQLRWAWPATSSCPAAAAAHLQHLPHGPTSTLHIPVTRTPQTATSPGLNMCIPPSHCASVLVLRFAHAASLLPPFSSRLLPSPPRDAYSTPPIITHMPCRVVLPRRLCGPRAGGAGVPAQVPRAVQAVRRAQRSAEAAAPGAAADAPPAAAAAERARQVKWRTGGHRITLFRRFPGLSPLSSPELPPRIVGRRAQQVTARPKSHQPTLVR